MKPLYRNLFLFFLLGNLNAQSISMNFGSNEAPGEIAATAVTAGGLPIAGSFWNNHAGAAGSAGSLTDSAGANSGASVTWTSGNTWRSASPGGTATSQNGILTKGYLDDSANSHLVTVSGIPYLKYTVYFVGATDAARFSAPTINGTSYTSAGGVTTVGTAAWGSQPWSAADVLVEGNHFLKVLGQAAPTLTVKGGPNQGGGVRGSIAGVQVENSYTGTLSYWDINGATEGAGGANPNGDWAGNNWSSEVNGTAATAGWVDGNAAVFSAGTDATDLYTVTLAGTKTADALWVQDGEVTLSGGNLALSGSRIIRVDNGGGGYLVLGSTLTADGPVASAGSYDLGSAQSFDTVFNHTGGTITSFVTHTIASGGDLVIGNGGVVNSPLTVAVGGTLTVAPSANVDFLSMLPNGSLTINGTLVKAGAGTTLLTSALPSTPLLAVQGGALQVGNNDATGNLSAATAITVAANSALNFNRTDAFDFNTAVSGAGNLNKNSTGELIRSSGADTRTGSTNIRGGTITLNGTAILSGTGYLGNPTNGAVAVLNVADTAALTVNGFMTLGDQTNAPFTVNQTGGTVTNTGATNNPGGNSISNRWGHWGGAATVYNLSAGSLNLPGAPLYLSWDSGASLNVSGTGVANIRGINMGFGNRANAATINLNGGTLNIGADGIITGPANPANKTINLNGGTLGALANWTGTVPMNVLANTLIDTTGGNINLGGVLTGTAAGLTITGGRTASLGGGGSYTGNTEVTGNTTLLLGGSHATTVNVASGSGIGSGSTNTPGSGTVAALNLAAGSKSIFRVGVSGPVDQLTVTGNLDVAGPHTLTVTATGDIPPATTFPLIGYGGISAGGHANIHVVGASPRLNLTKAPDDGSTVQITIDGFDSLIWRGNDGTNPNLWDVNTTENWLTSFSNVGTKFLANDVVIFDDSASEFDVVLSGTINPISTTFNNDSSDYTLSGDGIATGSLVKNSLAKVTLANDNTYLGATSINDGILQIGDGISGGIAAGSAVSVGAELILNLPPGGTYASPTSGGGELSVIGAGAMTFNPVILATSSVNLLFDRDGMVYCNSQNQTTGTVTINDGVVAFDGNQVGNRLGVGKNVTVNSGGMMAILGVNALPNHANSVNVNLNGGSLSIVTGGSPAIGAAGTSHAHIGNVAMNGALIDLSYSGEGAAYNNESVQLNGSLTVTGSVPSSISFGTGATNENSGLALNGNRIFDVADVTGDAGADLIIDAEIESSDGGGGVLTKQGAGKLVLSGANTYSGGNEVLAGTLSASSVADGAASGIGVGYLAVKSGATFEYTGAGAETTTRLLWLNDGSANINITNAAASLTFNPTGGQVTAPVVKLGPGTLVLGGAVSGAATLTVEEGTLALNGVNTHTGATTVNSGAVLAVNGTSISDDAPLAIHGSGKVDVTGDETVDTLFIDGVQQEAGVYEAVGNPGDHTEISQITGSGTITVKSGPSQTYAEWINSFFPGATDPNIIGPDADPDGDGIANAVEMVIGNLPNLASVVNLPTIELVTDPAGVPAGDYLKFSFRRSDASVGAGLVAVAETDNNLQGPWTDALDGVDGVVIQETEDPTIPGDRVDVFVPRGENATLFGRLSVTVP